MQVANPRNEPDRFATQILSLGEQYAATAILPATDPAVGALNAVRDSLPRHMCLMAPKAEATAAVLDKDENDRIAKDESSPLRNSYQSAGESMGASRE